VETVGPAPSRSVRRGRQGPLTRQGGDREVCRGLVETSPSATHGEIRWPGPGGRAVEGEPELARGGWVRAARGGGRGRRCRPVVQPISRVGSPDVGTRTGIDSLEGVVERARKRSSPPGMREGRPGLGSDAVGPGRARRRGGSPVAPGSARLVNEKSAGPRRRRRPRTGRNGRVSGERSLSRG